MASIEPNADNDKRDGCTVDLKESVAIDEALSENEKSIWKQLAENPRVIACTLLANCGAFLFGYDILVQGAINALPAFSIYFGAPFDGGLILPALWQGLWAAFAAMGIMLGASSNGFFMDKFGRRIMFAVGGTISAVGVAITFVSSDLSDPEQRRGILLLGKFIIGISMGIMMSTCQTYVSEISSPKLRTVLLGLYPFIITVGQMIAITVVFSRVADMSKLAFKIPFASQWAFSGYSILAGLILPESPVYLVEKGRYEKASKSLAFLGFASSADDRISSIQASLDQQQGAADNQSISFKECFQGTNLRRTRIVALLNTLQQFMGVSLVANSTYFFIMAGMDPRMSLTLNQIGTGIAMACTLVSWFIIGRVGRRAAILGSFAFAGLVYLGMGIAGFFPQNPTALRFIGVSVIMAASSSNLGVGTAYPVSAAEMPSVRLRAKTMGLGFFVNAFMTWIFSFTVPYMFNADQGNLGGKIGFVFMGFCVIGFGLSWLEIPETKNMTYSRIEQLFESGVSARRFKAVAEME
ncbi:general substrate transporter [Plectosphaerella plurivora]|uniref:General substrate transporter n=1 Tax=Plectosphaerella plurivora TaxID=936078 RepID=A0A9P8V0P0_9PEZI|nr:general substrate transporter [Plectosphaerella plurivora]